MTETASLATASLATASFATDNRFADPDAAFRMIIEAHRGLSETESADLNACLVLILANQAGDAAILKEAIALARKGLGKPG
jgi:Protein of unknown function (DUF2783)